MSQIIDTCSHCGKPNPRECRYCAATLGKELKVYGALTIIAQSLEYCHDLEHLLGEIIATLSIPQNQSLWTDDFKAIIQVWRSQRDKLKSKLSEGAT